MSSDTFSSVNSILERDATDTTYKYSLLQSVIETAQEYPQFAVVNEETQRVQLPVGIVVFKWLMYYYPFFLPGLFIAMKKGERESMHKIAFRSLFEEVTLHYEQHGGISIFSDELMHGTIEPAIEPTVRKLATKIRATIIDYPMSHLGFSQNNALYSIFHIEKRDNTLRRNEPLSFYSMVKHFGTYSISKELYSVFRDLGGFILGSGSVSRKWMAFLQKENCDYGVSEGELLKRFSVVPNTERDVAAAAKVYRDLVKNGNCECVWSGKKLTLDAMAVDHLLPFSVWKSNGLWNLMPVDATVNLKKTDNIPSPEFLLERKSDILACWDRLHTAYRERFEKEISMGLMAGTITENWKEDAFQQLCKNAEYLITVRGCNRWEG